MAILKMPQVLINAQNVATSAKLVVMQFLVILVYQVLSVLVMFVIVRMDIMKKPHLEHVYHVVMDVNYAATVLTVQYVNQTVI